MQNRRQATIAASLCLAVPLLFWLGAAVLALVVLRQGLKESQPVVMWSLLPAIAWFASGDPMPLVAALGAISLAVVLRQTVRLDYTLVAAAGFGAALSLLLPLIMPEVLALVAEGVSKILEQSLAASPQVLNDLNNLLDSLVQGLVAAIHTLVIVLCVLLGRYWQSELFNPNGFGLEFKQLRLPLLYSLVAVGLLFGLAAVVPELAGMAPVLSVPMMLAGLALLHSLASKKAGSGWMAPVYIALFIFTPYIYTLLIFLALFDSIFNFRSKLKNDTA